VCFTENNAGKDLNVKIAMWGCILTPASGCFTPNCSYETNISQGKADYIIVRYHFSHLSLCADIL
jgi:hypothetical protein